MILSAPLVVTTPPPRAHFAVFDSPEATVAKSATVQREGEREVTREVEFYNLDVIISVGYRVKSPRGTQFRIWATQRLREYIVKGFTLDDERLKRAGGGNYFDELLARIRDIRSSEKVFWRKVLDKVWPTLPHVPSGKHVADGRQVHRVATVQVRRTPTVDRPSHRLRIFGRHLRVYRLLRFAIEESGRVLQQERDEPCGRAASLERRF
jgi:hypothetical protein